MVKLMNKRRQSGFTLLEVMVGILCAGILALTMGSLLYFNYKGWKGLQAVADMQRDGSLAMNTMTRVIRGSASANILAANNSPGLTNNVEGWRFSKVGGRLVYVKGGAGMDLTTNVTGFSCASISTNVMVGLSLTESSMNTSMNMTNIIHPRN